MAEKRRNKRVALTLPPEVDDVLTSLSRLINTPKTAIITDLLLETMPAFAAVIQAVQDSKQGQQEAAYNAMAGLLGKASTELNQAHLDLGEIKGEFLGKK